MDRSRAANFRSDRSLAQKRWMSGDTDGAQGEIPLPLILETLEKIYAPPSGEEEEEQTDMLPIWKIELATVMMIEMARLGFLDDHLLGLIQDVLNVDWSDINVCPAGCEYVILLAKFIHAVCCYSSENLWTIIRHTKFSERLGVILMKVDATDVLKDLLQALLEFVLNCPCMQDMCINDIKAVEAIYSGLGHLSSYSRRDISGGELQLYCRGYKYIEDVPQDEQYWVLRSLLIRCMSQFIVKFSLNEEKIDSLSVVIKNEIAAAESMDILSACFDALELWIDHRLEKRRGIFEEPGGLIEAICQLAYTEGDVANWAINIISIFLKNADDVTIAVTVAVALCTWCPIIVQSHPNGIPGSPELWTRCWLTIWYEMIKHAFLVQVRPLWRHMQNQARANIIDNVHPIINSLAEFIVDSDFEFSSAAMRVIAVMMGSGNDIVVTTTYTALKEKEINIVQGLSNIIQSQEGLSELAIALSCVVYKEMQTGIDDETREELLAAIDVLREEDPSMLTEAGKQALAWLDENCSA